MMEVLGIVDVPAWLLTLLLFLLSLYLYSKYKLAFWSRRGVPHPKPTLFKGLSPLMKDGVGEFDLKMHSTYDKVVGIYTYHKPSLLILDPELARDITIKDFSTFPNRPANFLVRRPNDMEGRLTTSKGDQWRFTRNTISPIFSSGKMRKMSPILAQSCANLLKNVENEMLSGHPVEFRKLFGDFTMDAIASIGFGIELDLYKEKRNEFAKHAHTLFAAFTGLGARINAYCPPLYSLICQLGLDIDGQNKACAYFKHLVEEAKKLRGNDEDRADLLQLLLNAHKDTEVSDTEQFLEYKDDKNQWKKRGLTTEEVNGNSIAFLTAGYGTTAAAMTSSAYCLASNPECQDKLIFEIDSTIGQEAPDYDSIQKMEYLDCVVKEALRLNPPGLRIYRESPQDVEIAGYTIPKNTEIVIPVYAFHRSQKYWEEPSKYNPDRFLVKNKSKLTPYAFLPFGLGPRNCVAMRLAYMEAKCAIVTILQKYRFVPCEKNEIPMEMDSKGHQKPRNGTFLKLEKR
ncbi:cytochrome P450 3A18-like [Saccostrea echinata]|uniref:cytochrome P450 3A18-like n=1 Tax=Saccostrea echinata TaxID=191078 RepID=UPI002A80F17E|nr:cytochrome P450 3A18-like [Saccostrea echinata]